VIKKAKVATFKGAINEIFAPFHVVNFDNIRISAAQN
jgi:hypothetical protein